MAFGVLFVVVVVAVLIIVVAYFVGKDEGYDEATRTVHLPELVEARVKALEAERELHHITRDTFLRMAKRVEDG